MWRASGVVWDELARSAFGFGMGITSYWLSVRFMPRIGLANAEVQTLVWLVAPIIGVALASGRCTRWPAVDQLVALVVVSGLGWLVMRSAPT